MAYAEPGGWGNLLAQLPGCVYRCRPDQDFTIEFVSDNILGLTGYTAREFTSKQICFAALIHPEDRDRVFQECAAAIQARRPFELEYRLICRSGEIRWVWDRGVANFDALGRPVNIEGFTADITARRRTEDALRESQAFFEKTQAIGRMGSWVWEIADGNRLRWSAETFRIFGEDERQFSGTLDAFLRRVHPDDRDAITGASQYALFHGTEYSVDHRIVRPDGEIRWVHERGEVDRDSDGRPIRIVGVVQDITERKCLEERFLHVQRMEGVGRLAGGIAHEFNNLLTAILGYSDLLERRLGLGPNLLRELTEIRSAGERAAELTQQLLSYARKQMIAPRHVDLNVLVRGCEPMIRRTLGESIEFRVDLAADLWEVRADSAMIENAILQLALNARDAMSGRGVFSLKTANHVVGPEEARALGDLPPGPYVRMMLRDTGRPIPEALVPHLFDPFTALRADQAPIGGLGLASAQGSVVQLGGAIRLERNAECGNEFQILLPRIREAAPAGPASSPTPSGDLVLLVEDDASVRGMLASSLRDAGYTVVEAAHGQEALDRIKGREQKLHLVLADVVMPVLGGREVAETLRRANPVLPVLLMSGYADQIDLDADSLPGPSVFLRKPFTEDAMLRAVRELLATPAQVAR